MPMSVVYTNFGGELVHENRGGTETTYISDPLGSVIECRDASGGQTFSATYWPYGEIRTSTGTNPSQFDFVGALGYYRENANRAYVRARVLRKELARWMTVDPLWPSKRAYTYARNRPSQMRDKSGLYESGPTLGGDWPSVGWPPTDWSYGQYCGLNNWKKGCDRPKPKDCIDAACQRHDDCLSRSDYWTVGGASCNCKLAFDAFMCMTSGCIFNNSGWIFGFNQCLEAARQVYIAFLALCPTTGVIGTIGDTTGVVSDVIEDVIEKVEDIWPTTGDWYNHLVRYR